MEADRIRVTKKILENQKNPEWITRLIHIVKT